MHPKSVHTPIGKLIFIVVFVFLVLYLAPGLMPHARAAVPDQAGNSQPTARLALDTGLSIQKSVQPSIVSSGQVITYTLVFTNTSVITLTHVVITDRIPTEVDPASLQVYHRGAGITDTGSLPPYVWEVADLAPEAGGIITVTGVVSVARTGYPLTFINTAVITATTTETVTSDNQASALVSVVPGAMVSAGGSHTCGLKGDRTIACWGEDAFGQTDVPELNSGFVQVSAGRSHTCGLKYDGTLACWGSNDNGQTDVPGPNDGFVQVSAGGMHTCGLAGDSTITCWGANSHGQTLVPEPNSGFVQVSAGDTHTCGLMGDGTIVCWGDTAFGKTAVPEPNRDFVQVSAGGSHTCALKGGGVIVCWGDNTQDQTDVPVLDSGFVQVSAGGTHTCGLMEDRTISCWGENNFGQAAVPAPNSSFILVSAGGSHTCGLKDDGTITCWGNNAGGQAPMVHITPAELPDGLLNKEYTQTFTGGGGSASPYTFGVVSGGLPSGLSLAADGLLSGTPTLSGIFTFTVQAVDANNIAGQMDTSLTVWACKIALPLISSRDELGFHIRKSVQPGIAAPGQTVTYTLAFSNTGEIQATATGVVITDILPVEIDPASVQVTHSGAAITDTGHLPAYRWQVEDLSPEEGGIITITGVISELQTDRPTYMIVNTAYIVGAKPAAFTAKKQASTLVAVYPGGRMISAGDYHSCLLKTESTIACWGANWYGQLDVPAPNNNFVQVSAGGVHTCGLKGDGTLACWGWNDYGQSDVPEPNNGFVQVSVSGYHSCGLKGDGMIACWGGNWSGQTDVPAPNSGFVQVSAGEDHTCGLKGDGTIVCWGDNNNGKTDVPAPNSGFVQVSAGDYHNCGLKGDETLVCWGSNGNGQTDVPAPNIGFVQVSGGGYHTCGLKGDGTIVCWGANYYGQTDVPGLNNDFMQVSAGGLHTCGLKEDGTTACWGDNEYGQAPVVSIFPAALPDPLLNLPYTQTLTASGGSAAPYTFGVVSGGLPPGLSLPADGLLDGMPGQTGTFTFTVQALDANNISGGQEYVLTVRSARLGIRKSVRPSIVLPGDTITYTLAFSATGVAIVSDVVITDMFPAEIDPASVQVFHSGAAITATGSLPPYVWTVEDLAPNAWGIITLTGMVSAASGSYAIINNTAIIAGVTAEGIPTDYLSSVNAAVPSGKEVSAGGYHTCELKADGTIVCWGGNYDGQTDVPAPNSGFVQVSAGYSHTCGLKRDGTIVCWGSNWALQTDVPEPNTGFVQVSAGEYHTCGLIENGKIACWGYNDYGQTNVPAPNSGFVQVSAGYSHTCGLKRDGTIACWGANWSGQTDVPVPNSGFVQVNTGNYHTCGLKGDGMIACWGANWDGQADVPAPNSGFVKVSGGGYHTCGLKVDGTIVCWGANWNGQTDVPEPNSGFTLVSAGDYHTCGLKGDGTIICWGDNSYGQTDVPAPRSEASAQIPTTSGGSAPP